MALDNAGVQGESSTSTDVLKIEGASTSEAADNSQEQGSDSQVEKTDPGKGAQDRIRELVREKKELERQLSDRPQSEAKSETKQEASSLSPDGEKLAEQIYERTIAKLQELAQREDKDKQTQTERANEIITELKEDLGNDFESFVEFAKTERETYPEASIESLRRAWDKKGSHSEKVSNPTKGATNTGPVKVYKSSSDEDFVTAARNAVEKLK